MTSEQSRSPRHAKHRRRTRSTLRHIVLTALSFSMLLGVSACGIAFFEYHKLSGQITHVDALQTKDPNILHAAQQAHAANYLVIGSDSRAGRNSVKHNIAGERSDTTILIHLSKNRQHVTVVSIPRDSWVSIPDCTITGSDFGTVGTTYSAHHGQFNSAFSIGGARCTTLTVQKITGIAVTHYLKLDFVGFRDVVNALGTVTVCSPKAVDDPNSKLRLKAGKNPLNGTQALSYVRARETLGDGSDLGRIKRQQEFLGIVLRQALSGALLSNPVRLTDFLDAVTRAITTDPGTNIGDLRTLGSSMSGLDPKHVVFYTAPISNSDYSPPGTDQSGKVLLDPGKGAVLYNSIIDDTAGTSAARGGTPSGAATPGSSASKSASGSGSASSSAPRPNSNAGQSTCSL